MTYCRPVMISPSENAHLYDAAIRTALHVALGHEHAAEDALILDELGLCQGEARVDVAVVNGR